MSQLAAGGRPRLAFVSTIFLLPADAGGKIRTGNILRGMKGGAFEITLLMPATPQQKQIWRESIDDLCDHFVPWSAPQPLPRWTRAVDLLRRLPANVAHDDRRPARRAVAQALAHEAYDLVVYDFVHAAVLRPKAQGRGAAPELCFTHNVEAEILERHAHKADGPLLRRLWRSQAAKMRRFEGHMLRGFDGVVAVSERDAAALRKDYGVRNPRVIPTGVDLDFFAWSAVARPNAQLPPTAVFTASMDSAANIDGVRWFIAEVWPQVRAAQPDARFKVVGRNPPAALVREGEAVGGVEFTGYVDDVRDHVRTAQAFVMPLRVGGGTRLKAFEGMAMGCPVVSTAIGIEGLEVVPDVHYLLADEAAAMAAAVLRVFRDHALRQNLSQAARQLVELKFGHRVAAEAFERICLQVSAAAAPMASAELVRA